MSLGWWCRYLRFSHVAGLVVEVSDEVLDMRLGWWCKTIILIHLT